MVTKLTITRCEESGGQITPKSGDANVFTATINPSSYSHKMRTKFSGTGGEKDSAVGKSKAVPKFSRAEPETIGFSLTLDGTGVVPDAADTTVAGQVEKLRAVAQAYNGDSHEPDPVRIAWGEGLADFDGRLTSMEIEYNLFHPEGAPLRAKVTLSFIEAITEEEEAVEAGNTSPDLTHVVMVRAGDTLPLMCERIYRDPARYLEVARFNDLDGFRAIPAGTLLRFRPIR